MMTVEVETLVSTLAQYSPALWCGASYWTSACLSFLVCKIGAVIVKIPGNLWRMECFAMNRTWACNQCSNRAAITVTNGWTSCHCLPLWIMRKNGKRISDLALALLAAWTGTSQLTHLGFLLCYSRLLNKRNQWSLWVLTFYDSGGVVMNLSGSGFSKPISYKKSSLVWTAIFLKYSIYILCSSFRAKAFFTQWELLFYSPTPSTQQRLAALFLGTTSCWCTRSCGLTLTSM